MKPSLVVAAHGSRSQLATDEIVAFTAQLNNSLKDFYAVCEPAFLELAAPSIEASIIALIEDGVRQIHLLPYFLNSGMHVTRDIPNIINTLSAQYSNVEFTLLPPIGLAPQMLDVVAAVVADKFAHS